MGLRTRRYADVMYAINGAIAGLVAVTASAHVISLSAAFGLGAVGGVLMVLTSEWLLSKHIDDAVSAIPSHLVAGVWGTLALPWVADLAAGERLVPIGSVWRTVGRRCGVWYLELWQRLAAVPRYPAFPAYTRLT